MGNLKTRVTLTHYWVSGFGWETTIFLPDDFETFEVLGHNNIDGYIYIGVNGEAKHILKGVHK